MNVGARILVQMVNIFSHESNTSTIKSHYNIFSNPISESESHETKSKLEKYIWQYFIFIFGLQISPILRKHALGNIVKVYI